MLYSYVLIVADRLQYDKALLSLQLMVSGRAAPLHAFLISDHFCLSLDCRLLTCATANLNCQHQDLSPTSLTSIPQSRNRTPWYAIRSHLDRCDLILSNPNNPMQSGVIRCNQMQSDGLRCNPMQSKTSQSDPVLFSSSWSGQHDPI